MSAPRSPRLPAGYGLWALALLACSGCFELDPFLYSRRTTDEYVFIAGGPDAASTVAEARIEPLTISLPNGEQLGAVYLTADAQPPKAYVLYFHGQGGHLGGPGRYQFEHVKRLANAGYDVLAFDYRGWGTSTNRTPDETTVVEDGVAAYALLRERAGSSAPILFYGQSFGSAVSTAVAELHRPDVLVLDSAFASVQAFITDASGLAIPAPYLAEDLWDTEGRLRALDVPLLLLHGELDDYVRIEFSEMLFEAASGPAELIRVPNGEHAALAEALGGEAYESALDAFILPRL